MSEAYDLYQLGTGAAPRRARGAGDGAAREGAAARAREGVDPRGARDRLLPHHRLAVGRARVPQGARALTGRRLRPLRAWPLAAAAGTSGEASTHLKLARFLQPRRRATLASRLSLSRVTDASSLVEIGEQRRVAAVALRRLARELGRVLLRRLLVERARVRLADVEQPVGDRVDDELVVAVRLLGLARPGRLDTRPPASAASSSSSASSAAKRSSCRSTSSRNRPWRRNLTRAPRRARDARRRRDPRSASSRACAAPARASASASASSSSSRSAPSEPVDVPGRHDAAGAEGADDLAEAADVVDDGRDARSDRLQQRAGLVELGAVGEDRDGRLAEGSGDLAARSDSRAATRRGRRRRRAASSSGTAGRRRRAGARPGRQHRLDRVRKALVRPDHAERQHGASVVVRPGRCGRRDGGSRGASPPERRTPRALRGRARCG